jgi:hypothetical protein
MHVRRQLSVLTSTLAVTALVAVTTNIVPAAAQDALPVARDVVQRHVDAIGGAAAYASVQSMRFRGRFEIPAQKIAGDVEVLAARPAKFLLRVSVPGVGRIDNGFDGKVAWSLSPFAGPEVFSGRQLAETADDAWFDGPLHASDRVREMTTVARTEFDGRPAFKVRVVFVSGNEQMEFFDTSTGFQIGSESARATPQGVVQTVNILRDYKSFGPLKHASTFVQRALGFDQVITLTSCEYNTVADSAFELPAEIKALQGR